MICVDKVFFTSENLEFLNQISPKDYISRTFKININDINEFDIEEIFFSKDYVKQLHINMKKFNDTVCEKCKQQKNKDEDLCYMKNVGQKAFWINGYDFIILYWWVEIFSQINKIEKDFYQLHVNEILQ